MKFFIYVLISVVVLTSCTDEKTELLSEIKTAENTLFEKSQQLKLGEKLSPKLDQALMDALFNFYAKFPEDKHAPECLDKLHMKYSGAGNYEQAAMYGGILLADYTEYVNRAMILESLANIYDMNVFPRDTSKVRLYSEILLKENPDLPVEKVEDIKYRLENIRLTIGELILKRIAEE